MAFKICARILSSALLATVPLSGWAATAPAPQNTLAPGTASVIPPKVIFDIADDGTALHQQSQLQCPATLDGYARTELHVYDKAGFDVSCNYAAPKSDVTIYLTRLAPSQLAASFENARQGILKRIPDAVAGDSAVPQPPGLDWKSAGFASNNGALQDELLLADVSGWEFEVRATYANGLADPTHKVTADLTALMLKTAGAHLAACAAAPPPARTGQPVGNVDYMTALVLSGITMARLDKKPVAAPVWCAEGSFPVGETNPVFWRNIAFDGKSGQADRMVGTDPRIIEVRFDPAGSEVAAKQGTAMAVYDVVFGNADSADLIGIFNGRPSPSDVAKLIFSGKVNVLARFDAAGNKIQIFTETPAPPKP